MKPVWIPLSLVLAVVGCGGDGEDGRVPAGDAGRAAAADPGPAPEGWREHVDERRGFRVSLPPGWHRAEQSLSPSMGDPVEILLVGTFPLDESRGLCRSLTGIPPDQALVTIQERGRGAYGGPSFPPRPATFQPDPRLPGTSTWPYCVNGDDEPPIPMDDYWFGFGDAGRAFHVFVGIGREASPDVTGQAFQILDTLRFDPEVKPDWRSAG
jgi:hypothetical protein